AAVIMSYWNPIAKYGVSRFAADLASAGGAGAITPDLIPEEAADWLAASDQHDLDRVFLVAPSSGDERLVSTAAASRGFVYAAALARHGLSGSVHESDISSDGEGRRGRGERLIRPARDRADAAGERGRIQAATPRAKAG